MFRRIVSAALTAVLLVCAVGPAAAAAEKITPVIVVHGIGVSELYTDPAGENPQPLGFSAASIITAVLKLAPYVVGTADDPQAFIDDAAEAMAGFSALSLDKNGESDGSVGIINYTTAPLSEHYEDIAEGIASEWAICRALCDKIGRENVYLFNYDWRLDACGNAEILAEMVESVKAQRGVSKVTIVGCSEGTCILSAYLDKYLDRNDVGKAVFVNGAMNGLSVANVYNCEFTTDVDVYMNYLNEFLANFPLPNIDLRILAPAAPLMRPFIAKVARLAEKIFADDDLLRQFYLKCLSPIFGTLPIFWEFMPYEDFDSGVAKMLSIGFISITSGLYKKIQDYHGVQGRLKDNLKQLRAQGGAVEILSGYGLPAVPVTDDYRMHSDGLINTVYSSFGAKVADYGMTLAGGKLLSGDRIIDASRCAFPENTWFLRGVRHMDFRYGTESTAFLVELATDPEITDVASAREKTGEDRFVTADRAGNIKEESRLDDEDIKASRAAKLSAVLVRVLLSVGVTIGYVATAFALSED
ncbi:MAG: hypothetical protein K5647_00845 [Clostridiales bacterium]|nr:hypothetical protein [Clostridiales bacterium]